MKFLILALAFLCSACSHHPQFYPNEHYKSVGKDGAARDEEECEKLADDYMDSGKGKQIAEGAGKGAVVGGAVGAVGGALSGHLLGGALFGGAVGATAGGASSAMSPDHVRRNFITKCLDKKGYEIVGWK